MFAKFKEDTERSCILELHLKSLSFWWRLTIFIILAKFDHLLITINSIMFMLKEDQIAAMSFNLHMEVIYFGCWSNISLQIYRISSHIGIDGNEAADTAAKIP